MTDKERLQFEVILNADPAIKTAQEAGEEISKALTVTTKNSRISKMKSELKSLQAEASHVYDKLIEKAHEWAEATGTKSKQKIREHASGYTTDAQGNKQYNIPEYGQYLELQDRIKAKAISINTAVDKLTDAQARATNEANKQVDAQEKAGNAVKDQANSQQQAANAQSENAAKAQEVSAKTGESAENAAEANKAFEETGKAIAQNTETQKQFNDEASKAPEAAEATAEKLKEVANTPMEVDIDADVSTMSISELTRHLLQLQTLMKAIKKDGMPSDMDDTFNRAYDAAVHTNQAIKDYNKNLKQAAQNAEESTQATRTFADSFKDFSSAFISISQASGLLNKVKAGIDAIGPAAMTAGLISKEALTAATAGINLVIEVVARLLTIIETVINALKTLATAIINAFKKVFAIIKQVASTIKDTLVSAANKAKKAFEGMFSFSGSDLRRTLQMLTKYIFGVRSFFFFYRKLRKAVGEGLENLVQFESESNKTNEAITELRTSLLYLKNAWAAAFAPIINVVYPILVKFMDALAAIGNTIARFVAALTGQATVLQALRVSAGDYAESLKDAAGGASKAAKAQDDLNDRLAAFDDLNVLGVDDDKKKSPSGGGGGADDLLPDISEMFERIKTPVDDFAKLLREAWESGDGFRLGEYIAKKLGEGLDKAHEWLTGEGRDKIMKLARFIGTTMDGVLSDGELAGKIGQVLADVFVDAMDFINEVITPERMYMVGVRMAEMLNTAIPQIVPKIGETIGNLFKSAITNAWGFLTTADFKGWGQAIADGINNFIAQMNEDVIVTVGKATLTSGPKLENIGNGWELLGQDITLFAQGLIDALGTAIAEADWHSLGEGIGQLLANINFEDIFAGISDVGSGISSGLSELWGGFKNANPKAGDSLQPMVSVIGTLINDIPRFIQIANRLFDSIPWGDINNMVADLPDTVERIVTVLENLVPVLTDLVRLISEITGLSPTRRAGETLNEIDNIDVAAASARTSISLLNRTIVTSGGLAGATLGAIERGISNLFSGGKNDALIQDFKDMDAQIKHTDTLVEAIKGSFNFDSVANNIKDLVTTSKGSLDEIPVKLTEMKDSASTQSGDIKSTYTSTFDTVKQGSIESAKVVQDNFTLAADNIKTSFITAWEEIKKSISEGGDMFVALSDGMGNTVKALLNAMITGINTSITKPLQDISKSFNVLRVLDVNGTRPFAGIPYLNIPTIPKLAQGAVIPPNREFMAVLGDQKSGTNIEAPLDTIKAAVGDELAPYLEELIAVNRQVISAINNKPVINYRDIGKGYTTYTNEQKMMKGSML